MLSKTRFDELQSYHKELMLHAEEAVTAYVTCFKGFNSTDGCLAFYTESFYARALDQTNCIIYITDCHTIHVDSYEYFRGEIEDLSFGVPIEFIWDISARERKIEEIKEIHLKRNLQLQKDKESIKEKEEELEYKKYLLLKEKFKDKETL